MFTGIDFSSPCQFALFLVSTQLEAVILNMFTALYVKFVCPCLITSYNAFYQYGVGMSAATIWLGFWRKFRFSGAGGAATRFRPKQLCENLLYHLYAHVFEKVGCLFVIFLAIWRTKFHSPIQNLIEVLCEWSAPVKWNWRDTSRDKAVARHSATHIESN